MPSKRTERRVNMCGNKYAKKAFRTIELGWLHHKQGEYRQIKTKRGGGTRKTRVEVTSSMKDIQEMASKLFFPDGKSSVGLLRQFDVTVANFDRNPVSEI